MSNLVTKVYKNGVEYKVYGSGGSLGDYSTIQVSLASTGWSSDTQTVTATGVTAGNTVIVSPDPSSFDDYTDAVIKCSAQGADSLTFTCKREPENNITVNVIILI